MKSFPHTIYTVLYITLVSYNLKWLITLAARKHTFPRLQTLSLLQIITILGAAICLANGKLISVQVNLIVTTTFCTTMLCMSVILLSVVMLNVVVTCNMLVCTCAMLRPVFRYR